MYVCVCVCVCVCVRIIYIYIYIYIYRYLYIYYGVVRRDLAAAVVSATGIAAAAVGVAAVVFDGGELRFDGGEPAPPGCASDAKRREQNRTRGGGLATCLLQPSLHYSPYEASCWQRHARPRIPSQPERPLPSPDRSLPARRLCDGVAERTRRCEGEGGVWGAERGWGWESAPL